ncbi:hypothetical protein HF325_003035 [Metschnikowia pulcherrima]|uniref:Uncharacterized protein n=1 Tax=Metschnikowia pulcherrima TaxID=27326 RepID=A0A8H7LC13_9ASCO|nr:hypothetical protein HF325_003035 [Metschnikowia pulcherrima]
MSEPESVEYSEVSSTTNVSFRLALIWSRKGSPPIAAGFGSLALVSCRDKPDASGGGASVIDGGTIGSDGGGGGDFASKVGGGGGGGGGIALGGFCGRLGTPGDVLGSIGGLLLKGAELTARSSARRELISAKKGSPPGRGGAGGGTSVMLDDPESTRDAGTGGGASGKGGGSVLGGGGFPEGVTKESWLSPEATEENDSDRKCVSFFGLLGGIFGTFKEARDGADVAADSGATGATGGNGGGTTEGSGGGAAFGIVGATGTFLRGGLVVGVAGTGAECGREALGTGILGAVGGTIPDLLSLLTDLSLGIPPAKISPNCGAIDTAGAPLPPGVAPDGIGGPPADTEDGFVPSNGFDLSTVTVFFKRMPFWISPSKASRPAGIFAGGPGISRLGAPIGGGGGGGGGGPAIVWTYLGCCVVI